MTYGTDVSGLGLLGYASSNPFAPTIITWGPVSTQLLFASGFCAYGSVLLASVPPPSMYMKPTLFFGGSFFVQPSLDPLHCVSVGTHRVWTRCVGVIGHAGK